jgi:hypothetical protein
MKSLRQGNESLHLPVSSASSERSGGLLKTGFFSLLLHMGLVLFLMLNLMSPYNRSSHAVYRVTLRPFSPPGDGNPPGGPKPGLPGASGTTGTPSIPSAVEAYEKISKVVKRLKPPNQAGKDGKELKKKPLLH